MYGTLFRAICRYLGWDIPQQSHVSGVTVTIDKLPFPKRWRWLAGSVLHLTPIVTVLVYLAVLRLPSSGVSLDALYPVVIACAWAGVGPPLIWYYERFTLPRLYKESKAVINVPLELARVRQLIRTDVFDIKYSRVMAALWIILAMISVVSSKSFFDKMGIIMWWDWLLLGVGGLSLAFYSSIGFCLAYKGSLLAKYVAEGSFEWNVYEGDALCGLSFVARFAATTNLLFMTGWLFGPLLVVISYNVGVLGKVSVWLLIGAYSSATLAAFVYPVCTLRRRLLAYKREALAKYASLIRTEMESILNTGQFDESAKLDFLKKARTDIQAIKEWPLGIDGLAGLAATRLLIPLSVAVLAALWTADKISP